MASVVTAPVLTDGVVTLRGHRPGDVDDLVTMGRDPAATRWTTMPAPYERRHAEEWITRLAPAGWRDATMYGWAVEADGRYAGNVDVRLETPPDIGFVLAPLARGRGLASRAVRLATRWAFDTGVPVVHWAAHAGNLASWRVAHACGFTFHGMRPLATPGRGGLVDAWEASLRPDDPGEPRTTWWDTPVIEGERVRLRPAREDDVPRIVEVNADPRRRHWIAGIPDPYTVEHAREFVARGPLEASLGHRVAWTVADRADDRLLGHVSIFRLDTSWQPTNGEIGYWAHQDARGRGVTTEAVRLVVQHAFTPVADGGMGRTRLQIGASWGNSASRHVAERNGFTLVGHHHADGVLGDGTVDDGAWYELVRS